MATIKFMEWNVEWMNDLFVPGSGPHAVAAFRPDGEQPFHSGSKVTVKMRRNDLSGAIDELGPEVVVVCEGPSSRDELQLFFDTDVKGKWQVHLQPGSSQSVGIAVRTDTGKFDAPPFTVFDTAKGKPEGKAWEQFFFDTDGDRVQEVYDFERRPAYVELAVAGGKKFRVLGLHIKSKGIFEALEFSKYWQVSEGNRRKILAECQRVHDYFVRPYLMNAPTRDIPLIVCGDINDGPGLDEAERKLFGSGIERLIGDVWEPQYCLRNALFETLTDRQRIELDFGTLATTRFSDPIFNNVTQAEWIDHVLYSQNGPTGAGTPWMQNARVVDKLADGQFITRKYPNASDHRPVMADLVL